MITAAATDAGGIVNSVGINVGQGSTDQIIADNIAAAINLTGENGLTGLANNLEGYSQNLAAMGLNAPEQLVQILLDEIGNVLAENGVMDIIKKSLQITSGTVDMAKIGLDYATTGATVLANIQKLLTKLNKFQDVDITCIPSVKDTTSALTASLIDQLTAQYEALKQQLIIFYNSMICTSNDTVLDNVLVSANRILEKTEPLLDPVLQEYTGHTISEARNLCNQGFAYYGMIQRAAAAKRKRDEEDKAAEEQQSIEEEAKAETPTDDIQTIEKESEK